MTGALMVTMACLQVFVVRFFFQGARKGMCAFFVVVESMKVANACDRLCVRHTSRSFEMWTIQGKGARGGRGEKNCDRSEERRVGKECPV